jgi:hypothetical protein
MLLTFELSARPALVEDLVEACAKHFNLCKKLWHIARDSYSKRRLYEIAERTLVYALVRLIPS